jgi:nitroreductase
MDLEHAIFNRRSIRRFLKDALPANTIKEIIEKATWCPSWGNTQPWDVVVVTGSALETLKNENKAAILSGKSPQPDMPMPENWPVAMKKRYADVGKQVLGALSIKREDKQGRKDHYADMFYFFDVPALLIFTIDTQLPVGYAALDTGIFIQNICLLAQEKKIGTCILAAAIHFPDIVRKICTIPDNKRLVMGMAMGYPDNNSPVNQFKRQRIGSDEFVTWVT